MNDFSVTQTAFSGYRLLLAKPVTAAIWFVFSLAISLVTMAAVVWLAGPELMAMRQIQASGQSDPASMMAITQRMGPYYLFSYIFPWLTGAITLGAATRAVLKPQASGFGYLRFGGDEFRMLLTTLVIGVILIIAFFVLAVVGVIIMGMTGGRTLFAGMRGATSIPPNVILAILGAMTPALLVMLFLGVEFSLAPAETVAKKGVRIFGSWGMIKGRFWKTLATYILAAIPVLIIGAIAGAAGLAANGFHGNLREMAQSMQADMSTMSAAFAGKHWLGFILGAVARTVAMAAFIVPAAVIYQTAAPSDEASVFGDDDDDDDDDEYED